MINYSFRHFFRNWKKTIRLYISAMISRFFTSHCYFCSLCANMWCALGLLRIYLYAKERIFVYLSVHYTSRSCNSWRDKHSPGTALGPELGRQGFSSSNGAEAGFWVKPHPSHDKMNFSPNFQKFRATYPSLYTHYNFETFQILSLFFCTEWEYEV